MKQVKTTNKCILEPYFTLLLELVPLGVHGPIVAVRTNIQEISGSPIPASITTTWRNSREGRESLGVYV